MSVYIPALFRVGTIDLTAGNNRMTWPAMSTKAPSEVVLPLAGVDIATNFRKAWAVYTVKVWEHWKAWEIRNRGI